MQPASAMLCVADLVRYVSTGRLITCAVDQSGAKLALVRRCLLVTRSAAQSRLPSADGSLLIAGLAVGYTITSECMYARVPSTQMCDAV
jgi:hypothetical protein